MPPKRKYLVIDDSDDDTDASIELISMGHTPIDRHTPIDQQIPIGQQSSSIQPLSSTRTSTSGRPFSFGRQSSIDQHTSGQQTPIAQPSAAQNPSDNGRGYICSPHTTQLEAQSIRSTSSPELAFLPRIRDLYGPNVYPSDFLPLGEGPSSAGDGTNMSEAYFMLFATSSPRLPAQEIKQKFEGLCARGLVEEQDHFASLLDTIAAQMMEIRIFTGRSGDAQKRLGVTAADLKAVVNGWDAWIKKEKLNLKSIADYRAEAVKRKSKVPANEALRIKETSLLRDRGINLDGTPVGEVVEAQGEEEEARIEGEDV
ncbi:hypothetical protein GLAREA_06546 [Glarea lozoyensis ATCC 20868]|uniref:Uncharacterized protein n=1 Tax=Glarea lozoyensis (strain ATCC 20868 / MF5171) TaxID=1116229 RepID=S3E543_GLAL2|nr:uncharacterized protein GLAREA_06546 [Glarea lozoyensis ATCC 20868]EPE33533.1 hypothetical protein GLAREA_06546 [Glarea lozoyensis ATCC 20868]